MRKSIAAAMVLLWCLLPAMAMAEGDTVPPANSGPAMTWWQALLIGAVEGATEYLPVSSTGHILLAQRALGIEQDDAADAFAVVIQGGAILAILGLYWRRARRMTLGLLGRDAEGLRLSMHVLLAFAPFAIIALLFYKHIKDLFGLWESVAGWIAGGLLILVVVAYRRDTPAGQGRTMEMLTWRTALVIGLIQCVSMWPGSSRALMAMLGGLAVGLSLRAAVEFSFLLGLITLLAAAGYDALKHGPLIFEAYGLFTPLLGMLVAALAAALSVRWMVGYLEKYSLALFGYYRIALGLVIALLLWQQWL